MPCILGRSQASPFRALIKQTGLHILIPPNMIVTLVRETWFPSIYGDFLGYRINPHVFLASYLVSRAN